MNFFAGLSAGFGEAQGQKNAKMMDFLNEKSRNMAQLYGHLADQIIQSGGDQDIASEFVNRAKNWASANPLFDPKGYRELIKGEKGGFHSIIDSHTQRKIAEYNNQQSGGRIAAPKPSEPGSPEASVDSLVSGINPIAPGYGAGQGAGPVSQPLAQQEADATNQALNAPSPSQPTAGQPAPPPTMQGPSFGGGTSTNSQFPIPDMNDLLSQLTGGQPMTGSLGVPTPMGRMAMSIAPDLIKKRMELQDRWRMVNSMFDPHQGGMDQRSPTGSAHHAEVMREMGFNAPVTQWRPISRALFKDESGNYQIGPAMASWRDGSTWIRTGPGQEKEVSLIDESPKITQAKDGTLWAETTQGPIRVSSDSMPIQIGSEDSSSPTPGGGTAKSSRRVFTHPSPAVAPLVPTGDPTVGTILPPGLNPGATQGPPSARTSTAPPHKAYQNQGGFSLEKLETSTDPTDRQIAAYITHPESFDASSARREMWNNEFAQRTGGAIPQSPVPLREFRTDFMKQRNAIVSGFHASKNIANILNSTDGQLVGIIAGRWMEAMNKLGTAQGIGLLGDKQDANSASIKSVLPQISQEHPELGHKLTTSGDILAQKAADLITTMRLFNFADVKNTIGGVQGVSRVYQFLKDSLMNPGMDMPLILGHLSSLNRNMADGLLTLEQARWGSKIPYIREKELMSNLYWDPHVEQLISKYQSAAAEKGSTLSRQDALFLLWRNNKLEADPGNFVDVQKSPEAK